MRQSRNNLNCSFESGFCNWDIEKTKNNLNWELHQGETKSYKTGPSDDHTLQNKKGKRYCLDLIISTNYQRRVPLFDPIC